jgi:hypothetical protein
MMVMPHLRTIGPDDNGHEVVLRFGDRLVVVPAAHPPGWIFTEFPADVIQLQGDAAAASSHTFIAVAVGEGKVVLAAAGEAAGAAADAFTVRIRVMRDLTQPVQP